MVFGWFGMWCHFRSEIETGKMLGARSEIFGILLM